MHAYFKKASRCTIDSDILCSCAHMLLTSACLRRKSRLKYGCHNISGQVSHDNSADTIISAQDGIYCVLHRAMVFYLLAGDELYSMCISLRGFYLKVSQPAADLLRYFERNCRYSCINLREKCTVLLDLGAGASLAEPNCSIWYISRLASSLVPVQTLSQCPSASA
jgi:hypothetical protein